MNDDQFMKLFKYIEDFRKETNDRFDATASKEGLEQLMNTIDAFVKRLDDSEIEQVSRDAQWDRLLD